MTRPPDRTDKSRRPPPKPSPNAAILLRIAVQLESQGEALERLKALLVDNHELLQSLGELLRQLIAASSPRQGA
jgi:hypothetical protein